MRMNKHTNVDPTLSNQGLTSGYFSKLRKDNPVTSPTSKLTEAPDNMKSPEQLECMDVNNMKSPESAGLKVQDGAPQ